MKWKKKHIVYKKNYFEDIVFEDIFNFDLIISIEKNLKIIENYF